VHGNIEELRILLSQDKRGFFSHEMTGEILDYVNSKKAFKSSVVTRAATRILPVLCATRSAVLSDR
jgi:hypothetical protein